VILTSDNPRSEDPEAILEDIKKGIPAAKTGAPSSGERAETDGFRRSPQVIEVLDRREAIEKLVSIAEPGDVLFVLGKGHEDYQIIGDKKIPFDDRLVIQESLKRKTRVFFS
jgi:UDP-N-acetylmuramoyl-L-alanyl-D-glutamate--2,6-diaminopimelate ligase